MIITENSLIFRDPNLQLMNIQKSIEFNLCAVCLQYQIGLCNYEKLTLPEIFHPSQELDGWGKLVLGRVNVSVENSRLVLIIPGCTDTELPF